MPLLLGSALLTGFAHSLWSYNRENWQWDWQVRQASKFQIQNMQVSRYSLFREDIRDLAGLTTNKMDSYLIVNTLKLGFIVTLLWNYDRTDEPVEEDFRLRLFVFLFSLCFCTSFFFLITSIWFSMHALIVSQAFMTKLLLQTIRVPFASDEDIEAAAPQASDYETDVQEAFRVPLVQQSQRTPADTTAASSSGSAQHGRKEHVKDATSNSVPQHLSSESSLRIRSRVRKLKGQSSRDARSSDDFWESDYAWASGLEHAAASTELHADSPQHARTSEGDISCEDPMPMQGEGPAPHLKFYRLLMGNWQPFDLYSKVSMSIGTSTMLSGFGYFSLYYGRDPGSKDSILVPTCYAWFIFFFMSILAWWSMMLELILKPWGHILLAVIALSGPTSVTIVLVHGCKTWWSIPLGFVMQSIWVIFICVQALTLRHEGGPQRWRASLYMRTLEGSSLGTVSTSPVEAICSTGCESRRSRAISLRRQSVNEAALQLFQCLDTVLESYCQDLLPFDRERLSKARFSLQELLDESGETELKRTGSPSEDEGLWLLFCTTEGRQPDTFWVPCSCAAIVSRSGDKAAVATTLDELIIAVGEMVNSLNTVSSMSRMWTPEDQEQLAGYGGEQNAGRTVRSFQAQFRSRGRDAQSSMGKTAHMYFFASVCLVSLSWVAGSVTSALICASNEEAFAVPSHGMHAPYVALGSATLAQIMNNPAGHALFDTTKRAENELFGIRPDTAQETACSSSDLLPAIPILANVGRLSKESKRSLLMIWGNHGSCRSNLVEYFCALFRGGLTPKELAAELEDYADVWGGACQVSHQTK